MGIDPQTYGHKINPYKYNVDPDKEGAWYYDAEKDIFYIFVNGEYIEVD